MRWHFRRLAPARRRTGHGRIDYDRLFSVPYEAGGAGAAADLELRLRVETYDDQDDVSDARRAALTSQQQAEHDSAFQRTSQVLAAARQAATASP